MEIKEVSTKLDGFTVDLTDQETALETLCDLGKEARSGLFRPLGFSLKASARLNAVEVTVDIHLQQDRRVVCRSAGFGWNDAIKTQLGQVEFIDENVNYAHRIGIADVVVEAFEK